MTQTDYFARPPLCPDVGATSPLAARATEFAQASRSAATRRAYEADFRHFQGWCDTTRTASLPARASTVILYLASLAGTRAANTLSRRLIAIRAIHRAAGLPDPTDDPQVGMVLSGVRRQFGTAQVGKEALHIDDLRRILETLDSTKLSDCRDHALLLIGFAAALRRSEIAALTFSDLTFDAQGVILRIRRSKTDQIGEGAIVGIPYGSNAVAYQVRSLQRWIARVGMTSGHVFCAVNRHGQTLAHALTGDSSTGLFRTATAA